MANDFYTKTNAPSSHSNGSSATIRAEFAAIEAAFDKLPSLTEFSNFATQDNIAITANIPMAGFKHTGAAQAAAAGEYVEFAQWDNYNKGEIRPGSIEVNSLGTGNRFAAIDFHGDDINADYSFRIARGNTGVNANTSLIHNGSGDLGLYSPDSGRIICSLSNVSRFTIDSIGNYFSGLVSISSGNLTVNGIKVGHTRTWQTPARNLNTDYTSPVDEEIMVNVTVQIQPSGSCALIVGGVGVAYSLNANSIISGIPTFETLSAIVPPNTVYVVNSSNVLISGWREYRS